MRTWLVALLVVALGAMAGFAFTHRLESAGGSSQLAVEQRLMCPQCRQTRLDVCDRPICADMKSDISRRLAAGESPDLIVGSYRQAYGTAILADQQPGGLSGLLPWAAVALGLVALAVLWLRRRDTPVGPAAC